MHVGRTASNNVTGVGFVGPIDSLRATIVIQCDSYVVSWLLTCGYATYPRQGGASCSPLLLSPLCPISPSARCCAASPPIAPPLPKRLAPPRRDVTPDVRQPQHRSSDRPWGRRQGGAQPLEKHPPGRFQICRRQRPRPDAQVFDPLRKDVSFWEGFNLFPLIVYVIVRYPPPAVAVEQTPCLMCVCAGGKDLQRFEPPQKVVREAGIQQVVGVEVRGGKVSRASCLHTIDTGNMRCRHVLNKTKRVELWPVCFEPPMHSRCF